MVEGEVGLLRYPPKRKITKPEAQNRNVGPETQNPEPSIVFRPATGVKISEDSGGVRGPGTGVNTGSEAQTQKMVQVKDHRDPLPFALYPFTLSFHL